MRMQNNSSKRKKLCEMPRNRIIDRQQAKKTRLKLLAEAKEIGTDCVKETSKTGLNKEAYPKYDQVGSNTSDIITLSKKKPRATEHATEVEPISKLISHQVSVNDLLLT